MIHLSIHHRNCRQVTTTTDSLLMSCFHLHGERNIIKLCFGSSARESISNMVATGNKLKASIHPSIQQPSIKPSELCLSFMVFCNHLSPLRARFTFCLDLPDPKVSKCNMEDLACSFFHPLDHTFWSLLTG